MALRTGRNCRRYQKKRNYDSAGVLFEFSQFLHSYRGPVILLRVNVGKSHGPAGPPPRMKRDETPRWSNVEQSSSQPIFNTRGRILRYIYIVSSSEPSTTQVLSYRAPHQPGRHDRRPGEPAERPRYGQVCASDPCHARQAAIWSGIVTLP